MDSVFRCDVCLRRSLERHSRTFARKDHRLTQEGYSQRTIASRLRLSRKAVRNAIKSPTSHRGRCGRRRLSPPRQDRLLKVLVTKDPRATSAQLAQQVSETGDAMSARTVRRRLQEDFQLVARRPAKVPLLTERQRKLRLQFCREHVNKDAEWWDQVMFSDESTFQQVRGGGTHYVRRKVGQRFDTRFTEKTVKHSPSVMVWCSIKSKGRCGLELFQNGEQVNATRYLKLLEEKVPLHMAITNTSHFSTGLRAICHTAKV